MPILSLIFEQEINVSAQVGDNVYYIMPNANGEFDWANINNIVNIGYPISGIINLPASNQYMINIEFPDPCNNCGFNMPPANPTPFIMFGKDNTVNVSGLTGYFAEVEFKNNSNKKIELFSVGSDISESSK